MGLRHLSGAGRDREGLIMESGRYSLSYDSENRPLVISCEHKRTVPMCSEAGVKRESIRDHSHLINI